MCKVRPRLSERQQLCSWPLTVQHPQAPPTQSSRDSLVIDSTFSWRTSSRASTLTALIFPLLSAEVGNRGAEANSTSGLLLLVIVTSFVAKENEKQQENGTEPRRVVSSACACVLSLVTGGAAEVLVAKSIRKARTQQFWVPLRATRGQPRSHGSTEANPGLGPKLLHRRRYRKITWKHSGRLT